MLFTTHILDSYQSVLIRVLKLIRFIYKSNLSHAGEDLMNGKVN